MGGGGGGHAHLEVVAPPISSGILRPCLSISLATWIISSSDGVINPDNPIMSALSLIAVWRIFSHGVITPRSITLQTNDKEKSRVCNNRYTHQRSARRYVFSGLSTLKQDMISENKVVGFPGSLNEKRLDGF